tara:strand:+ start:83 stop:640 length:558 start_codon:yes stop_codon:yes gene_type:complete
MVSTAMANSFGNERDAPYEVCALCHGLDGNSRMAKFPKLAGQPAAYIEKQLNDFLSGRRTNDGGQMEAIVTEIALQDYPVVAEWFSSQPAPKAAQNDNVRKGASLFTGLGCAECHATVPIDNKAPHLTAQHADYLAKQMTDFRNGNRFNDIDGVMRAVMETVTDAQIEELAAYLSATERGSYDNR